MRQRGQTTSQRSCPGMDDCATHSELAASHLAPKRRRMTITVMREGASSSSAVHQVPLPESGWTHITLAVPPVGTDGNTAAWPSGALRPSAGTSLVEPVQLSQIVAPGDGEMADDGGGMGSIFRRTNNGENEHENPEDTIPGLQPTSPPREPRE